MNNPDWTIISYIPAAPSRGGRKKNFIKIEACMGEQVGVCSPTMKFSGRANESFPELVKLSEVGALLGMSRPSGYRMVKQGLKTVRPTQGDRYVRREDLEDFLRNRVTQKTRTLK